MNVKQLNKFINRFVSEKLPRLEKLDRYYLGKHEILNKPNRTKDVVDTKAVNNYARLISTLASAYFLGKPLAYKVVDVDREQEFKNLAEYLTSEEEQQENFEHALNCSIYGKSYELWNVGLDGKIDGIVIDPKTMFLIKDNTIFKNILYAVRFQIQDNGDNEEKYTCEVYDDRTVTVYTYIAKDRQILEGTIQSQTMLHGFDRVPVVEFVNNSKEQGDFEPVLTLIDAYNEAVSTSIDDLKDFSDAYLMLKNMRGTDSEDIKSLKENKVLLVDENGDAKWLIKDVNDSYSQNIKNRLNQDIHKFSLIPDMTDKEFAGNSSGVALGFKLLGLEQLGGQKEMYFKKAINKRLELVIAYNNFNITPQDIQKIFTRNTPKNLVEIANVVSTLVGTVSQETLLSILPFIEDAKQELDKIKKEEQGYTDDMNTPLKDNKDGQVLAR